MHCATLSGCINITLWIIMWWNIRLNGGMCAFVIKHLLNLEILSVLEPILSAKPVNFNCISDRKKCLMNQRPPKRFYNSSRMQYKPLDLDPTDINTFMVCGANLCRRYLPAIRNAVSRPVFLFVAISSLSFLFKSKLALSESG